jgi:FkbM family methyltransferase|tara:strand:+ start:130 stop:750 length:621 start_codon:yes stop_codon:yes gene_type:complete
MKQVYDYWVPDSDAHFERLITKRIKNGGPAEYQDDVRDAAYEFIENFDTVIDVGANIGFYTVPFATKFNKVIAFEPMAQVYECLIKNTKSFENVILNYFALGDKTANVHMQYDAVNTGNSYITEEAGSIKVKRLDDSFLPPFQLIKIDCERHELEVLKGAEKTLLKYKPIVIVEQHEDTEYCAGTFLKGLGAKELTNVRKDYIFGW